MIDQQAILNVQYQAALEARRPFMLLRPSISLDGDMWCVLYGSDLMDGVAGFGATPDAASYDFDKNWTSQRTPAAIRAAVA